MATDRFSVSWAIMAHPGRAGVEQSSSPFAAALLATSRRVVFHTNASEKLSKTDGFSRQPSIGLFAAGPFRL